MIILALASILNFLCIAFGAFGAHFLEDKLSAAAMVVYKTAVQYGFYGSLGLLALGFANRLFAEQLNVPCLLLAMGTICFSGSLFLLVAIPSQRWIGAITPIGGLLMLSAWIWAAVLLWRMS